MTFLLSEDKALREKLQGMTVTDQKSDNQSFNRQVGVFYGQPDQELRTQVYPYITIDMIDIQRDTEREHRGIVPAPDYMDLSSVGEDQAAEIHLPIPVTIDYQVTTYARHPRHDREIIGQLLYSHLPLRFGVLKLDDGTARRMDVMDVSKRDFVEQAKRLFVNSITVRVSSEVPQDALVVLYKTLSINLDNLSSVNAGGRPGNPDFTSIGSFITRA
jgi:hypothetical protein